VLVWYRGGVDEGTKAGWNDDPSRILDPSADCGSATPPPCLVVSIGAHQRLFVRDSSPGLIAIKVFFS
jgi:hypothetical protein